MVAQEENKTNATALAILLLAKVFAKANKVSLTKDEKFAFAQIAASAGNNLPVFARMIEEFRA